VPFGWIRIEIFTMDVWISSFFPPGVMIELYCVMLMWLPECYLADARYVHCSQPGKREAIPIVELEIEEK